MTLDEAIKHCEEKAKELSNKAYAEWGKSMSEEQAYNCNECAKEHEQLAEWLKDYKRLLNQRDSYDIGYAEGHVDGVLQGEKLYAPKLGEWKDHSDEGYVECPFCGSATNCEDNKDELHFCWNCGAQMVGG